MNEKGKNPSREKQMIMSMVVELEDVKSFAIVFRRKLTKKRMMINAKVE